MATLDRMNKERIDRRISEESTPSHHNSTSFDRYNMVTLHGEISTHKDSLACNTNEESAAAGGSVASSDRRSMTLRSQSLNCLGNDTSAHAKDACGSRNSTGEVAATMNYLYTVKTLQRHRNMERKASARNLILPSSHSLLTGHHNKRTELPPPQQQPSSPSEQTPLMITVSE